MRGPTIVAAALVLAGFGTSAVGNLIPYGDFEGGNPNFVSDYTFSDASPPPNMGEGYYSVVNSVSEVHGLWLDQGDHTTGSGRFFVANGSGDTTNVVGQTADPIVITRAGTPYRFEAWITTVYYVTVAAPGPTLSFQVGNGTDWYNMGTSQTFPRGSEPGEWRLAFYDGVFESSGEYYVRLMNAQAAAEGNDMGIDDLYFGLRDDAPSYDTDAGDPNPPIIGIAPADASAPGTLALIAVGAALAGLTRRRRRAGTLATAGNGRF
jgi:hypothetical protein